MFIESEVKRAQLYRNGELTKLLGKLGIKVVEFLTPSTNYVVTTDHAKCSSKQSGSSVQSPLNPTSPTKPARPESRAQVKIAISQPLDEITFSKFHNL